MRQGFGSECFERESKLATQGFQQVGCMVVFGCSQKACLSSRAMHIPAPFLRTAFSKCDSGAAIPK